VPRSTRQPDASTPHSFAAAATSIARAVAPARRSGIHKARTEVDPPVAWKPVAGLKYAGPGGAASTVTCSMATSSSSASSIGMEV
jgi:hypothetical protein